MFRYEVMSNQTLQFYKNNNEQLIQQYNSVSFESVHQDWLEFLPQNGSLIVDVGAGSGRDALWLYDHHYQVIAVDPVVEFFEQFKKNSPHNYPARNYPNSKFEWVVDSLPELNQLQKYTRQVSLILLSAVWMHLTTEERIQSFHTFSKLNKQNGLLVISLRHGKSPDERLMYSVSIDEIETIANECHYQIKAAKQSDDQLSRTDVFWETIVLEKVN